MSSIAQLPVKDDVRKAYANPAKARARKWLKLRYLAVLAVCGWAVYYYWHVQYPQLQTLASKQQQLQQKLDAANKQHAELVKKTQQLQDDEYIARYASDHFNLALPGQVTFDVKH